MSGKIKLGISSCLLGNNVRFDGGNKLSQDLIDSFGDLVEWVPMCPEVESGLPVPREPMQLVGAESKPHLITLESKIDRTDDLSFWLEGKLEQLAKQGLKGFVLKARSPSCGVHDTPLYSTTGELIGVREGLFAEFVKSHFPSLPIEDEETLRAPGTRERFLSRIPA
jgi:uncharacterized protein YbbK (DUF523 family)